MGEDLFGARVRLRGDDGSLAVDQVHDIEDVVVVGTVDEDSSGGCGATCFQRSHGDDIGEGLVEVDGRWSLHDGCFGGCSRGRNDRELRRNGVVGIGSSDRRKVPVATVCGRDVVSPNGCERGLVVDGRGECTGFDDGDGSGEGLAVVKELQRAGREG